MYHTIQLDHLYASYALVKSRTVNVAIIVHPMMALRLIRPLIAH